MGFSSFALVASILVSAVSDQTASPSAEEFASKADAKKWLAKRSEQRIIVVTDTREQPVKRTDQIPVRWLSRQDTIHPEFTGKAQPGEFYVFQVSLLNNGKLPVTVSSTSVNMGSEAALAVCLNQAVSQEPGKRIEIAPGKIQPLWIGVEFDKAGEFSGSVQATIALGESGYFQDISLPVSLHVSGSPVANHGVDEGWRLSRLKWLLPSDLGVSRHPTKGFQPLRLNERTIELTSAILSLDETGLPAQIAAKGPKSTRLLKKPSTLAVVAETGEVKWSQSRLRFTSVHEDQIAWENLRTSEQADLKCEGSVDFDGFAKYRLILTAKEHLKLKDVQLQVPYREAAAKYQLGLGYRGGFTPASTDWKWNVAFQQDCIWLGDVTAGAQWRFKGSNYTRPLVNIYYGYRPLNLPDSWGNFGRGGIRVNPTTSGTRLMEAYSGIRTMEPGDKLEFNFDIQITPSRPLNTEQQWATRYYHPGDLPPTDPIDKAVDTAKEDGANVLNVHQRQQVNPFINYPFNDFSVPDLKKYIEKAHKDDIRVKLYYTTRELTWQLPEIWALKSFGESIIEPGPGAKAQTVINPNGANPKLVEALEGNFIPAWVTTLDGKYAGMDDLSVITRPDSAWTDYYLHGLDWLVKNLHADGVYIDDTALDRTSLQRARHILEDGRPAPLIDLHSWNHEDPLAARGSSTSIYMELFPYIDRIWLGEGFDYQNATPDYWLVSMSGIPYGVMSEMLQSGGNVWRGMLFGETCRLGWSGDPRSMWQFWDKFGMKGTQMIGWWDPSCPVQTDSKDVLATVYKKNGKSLIAVANWTNQQKNTILKIDWHALGLDPKKAKLTAYPISGFQGEKSWKPGDQVSVPAAKGWLIVAE